MIETERADATSTGGKIPLVLLPGSLCDETMWAAQVAALSDIATTQIVVWDSHDDVGDAAEAAFAAISFERFALVGFSLGGYVALQMICASPDRISGLALLDTSAKPDDPSRASAREANIVAFEGGDRDVIDRFAQMTLGPQTSPQIADAVRTMMHRNAFKGYARQQRAMMTRSDARPHLANIRCPALVLCGTDDAATPPALHREMAEALPRSRYVEIPGVGHMTPMEAPSIVNAELRSWLKRLPS